MEAAKVIVVGSGVAGTFAAYQLRGKGVLVLDVGQDAPQGSLSGNLYDLRQDPHANPTELFAALIGEQFESLHNVYQPYLSPKLKAPHMRFVTDNARHFSPVESHNFVAVQSFAVGGLANAWGAGLYRFNDYDLAGFPIGAADLEPYYDAITAKVGINGCDDDLSRFFGPARGLQAPLKLDRIGRNFLYRYEQRRQRLNRQGLYVGRPRLAVLTQEHDGRTSYGYDALDFFRARNPSVYTPAFTLREMVTRREIAYEAGVLVERYAETEGGVAVIGRDCQNGDSRIFRAKQVILAGGALNTAKIVLQSNDDFETKLPLLENNVSYLPLLDLRLVGAALEREFYPGATLNAVYSGEISPTPIQMTLYGTTGTLRSDFLLEFPLSARGNIVAAKYLVPALVVVQLFYPDASAPTNYLRLRESGALEVSYQSKQMGKIEAQLLKLFRQMGYWGLSRFCKYLTPGNSFHYAGALPMQAVPAGRYQTDKNGLLFGTRNVYIADAANFTALPSKNHSFTMMANAMRIAAHVLRSL
jgi:choline dehydrogenase-like flavoprotein